MSEFLTRAPRSKGKAFAHILLAHGAGAPMTSEFLETMTDHLNRNGMTVSRFEFAYMAERRQTGKRRPPPRIDKLLPEYIDVVRQLAASMSPALPLFIGGKSMGGRIASMIADDLFGQSKIAGLVCLGYPFHPVGKPEKLRTSHLEDLQCPTLIVQGDRDALGSRADVDSYTLSPAINLQWARDGDHDLKPRRASGRSQAENLQDAADAISQFARDQI